MPIILRKQSPHPSLQDFVKSFWFLDLSKGNPLPMSIAPVPEQCLYFYPKNTPTPLLSDGTTLKSPNNIIIGQAVSRTNIVIPDNYLMFKIFFQAGGFYRLFGTPMTYFADSFVETISVLGNPIKELQEKISNAENFETMVKVSEAFLLKKARNLKIEKHSIDTVLNQSNFYQFSLDKLAYDACLSSRQFERKFLERTGVSPKIYQRIVRFNRAMILKAEFPQKKWIDITYECGYFDQMHLLRDFKQFTGETPSDFDFENAIIY